MSYLAVRRRHHRSLGQVKPWKQSFAGTADIAVGGGTAAGAALATRAIAPAGSFWARRAGSIGVAVGALVALASREKLSGIVAAVIVGGTIELVQLVSDYRVSHPKVR